MSCTIFDKPLILDADLNSASVDISKLRALLGNFDTSASGLWQPIVIKSTQSYATYCEPLYIAGSGLASAFSPCNCNDNSLDIITDNQMDAFQDSTLNCTYCGAPTATSWNLEDQENNTYGPIPITGCCDGACDVRMKRDDYIPKIRILDQSYISGFLDWKYHQQFPACNNPGLGFEKFITISKLSNITGVDLCIDWKLKESMGEIEYNKISSQYDDEYSHNKALVKAKLISQTCGNFIMTRVNPNYETEYVGLFPRLSGLIGSEASNKTISLPLVDQFQQAPYGLDKQTYNNIFINNSKVASYWKWNYTSGIIGWYRYYDMGRVNDQRPIAGVDLYISPGDIFFATNDGPEPAPSNNTGSFIKSCPSGLKVVYNNTVDCIIPSGSNFLYVSSNIYPQFYSIYNTILANNDNDANDALTKACLLATAPQYDKVTVDLLKENILETNQRNNLGQLDKLNRQMSVTTSYDSVSDLNFISNKTELVSTLANKYGAYLWVPPNSTKQIEFNIPARSDSFYLDLTFDMVIKNNDLKLRSNCRPINSCGSKNYTKSFFYDQSFTLGNSSLSTACFDSVRHVESCSNGMYIKGNFTNYCTLYLNASRIKSVSAGPTCYTFQDIYKRVIDPDNIVDYCGDCDTFSSFYLVPNANLTVCRNGDFCYQTLARTYNNNAPINQPLNLKERYLADGAFRFKRSYNARAFNPHIDLVAFHKDNGVFFRSKSFGSDRVTVFDRLNSTLSIANPKISFTTKDTGIKLYHIHAEKLQSDNSTASCKRFPVDLNSCKCYGLNITDFNNHPYLCGGNSYSYADVFLPGLSTKHSPRLLKYGGYSQSELDSLFGTNVLTAGGSWPVLNNKIIADQPYGCERSVSISLRNYVNTEWSLSIDGLSTDHSDVTISVAENGDPTALFARYVYNDYYFEARNNENWKRFFTKVEIEKPDGSITTAWKDQNKKLLSAGDTVNGQLTIKLQNPYLQKLTQLYNTSPRLILFPPSGDLLSGSDVIFGQPVSYGDPGITSRGDETSTVNLTFTNKPRKQVLAFSIKSPSLMGGLQKGFFHPNKGLTTNNTYINKSPFKNNAIYYDEPLYENGYDDGTVLMGSISSSMRQLFNEMSSFDLHKKARLYLYIRGNWYRVAIPNLSGFKHLNYTYVSQPTFFEYVHHENQSQNIPGLFPVSPKQHIPMFFVSNHPTDFRNSTTNPKLVLSEKFILTNTRSIILPGSRYYFMIPETDPAVPVGVSNFMSLSSMSDDDAAKISVGDMIILNDNTRWIFNGGSVRSQSSYGKTDHGYLYQNFSDLHITYEAVNSLGYIYNTKKTANHQVHIYNDRGNRELNKVLSKELFVVYDKNNLQNKNTPTLPKFRLFTRLELQNKVRTGYSTIDPLLIKNLEAAEETIRQYSFTIFAPTLWLQAENDYYLNSLYKTKWGDMIYYDGTVLDPLAESFVDDEYWYPKPLYKNSFYKIIVNNHQQNKHRYKFFIINDGQTYDIDHNDLVYYNIHQKYNTTYDNNSYSSTSDYHNYLPFMDINLVSSSSDINLRKTSLGSLISSSEQHISGTVLIGGFHTELPDNHQWGEFLDPNSENRFWINLPANTELISSFVPRQTIYSTTLRIDDPMYWLDKTLSRTRVDNSLTLDCTRNFQPVLPVLNTETNPYLSSHMRAQTISRNQAFYKTPIYCDTDQAAPSCGQQPCQIKNIGSVDLTSVFKAVSNTKQQLNAIPAQTNIPFLLTYDAGNYNPFGVQALTELSRFEVSPDSWLDTNNGCSSEILRPLNLRSSTLDPRYQKALTSVDNHSILIENTDKVANEMLFRMLYGEKRPINKQILFKEQQTLSVKDFLSYSEPKLTATDIYDQILYNYDRSVTPTNLIYNSTLTISGKLTVGKSFSLNIGSTNISLSIARETSDLEDAIVLRGKIGNKDIYGKLYIEKYQENSLIVTDGATTAPASSNEEETISLVQTYTTSATHSYFSYSWPVGGNLGGMNGSCYLRSAFLPWDIPPADSTPGYWGKCEPAEGVDRYPRYPPVENGCELVSVEEGKVWTPGAYDATVIFPPSISTYQRPTQSKCTDNFSPCKDFQYAYCRRSHEQSCASCPDTFTENDGMNFEYEFEMCRHKMNLYGHTYREKHFEEINNNTITTCFEQQSNVGTPTDTIQGRPTQNNIGYNCNITNPTLDSDGNPAVDADGNPIITNVVSPGLARGCWGPRGDPRCRYVVGDIFGWYITGGWCACSFVSGGDWQEYCVLKKCLNTPASTRKIYHKKTIKRVEPYNPQCPSQLCTISYNNYSVSITIPSVSINIDSQNSLTQNGSKTECIFYDNFQSACPYITVNSFPSDFIIQENINSECSACNQSSLKINLETQTQNFATIKEKRKCIIGTFVYGVINPKPLIRFGSSNLGSQSPIRAHCCDGILDSAPCYGNGSSMTAQCGGGYEWFACLGSLNCNTAIDLGTVSHRPLGQIVCEFSVPAMAEGPAAGYQLDEWRNAVIESYSQGSRGQQNNHIPEEDIIQGLVPGSQSGEVQFKTYRFKSWKARPNVGATGSEVEEWYVNVVVAYYNYEYIRTKTIQDVLKPPGVICYNQKEISPTQDIPDLTLPEPPGDGGGWDFVGQVNKSGQYQCWGLGYPEWFTLPGWYNWWGWQWYSFGARPNLPSTFVNTKNYIKSNGCTNNIESYYRYSESNRDNTNWYAPPMPCADTDWNCWVGQDLKSAFLTAKYGTTWV